MPLAAPRWRNALAALAFLAGLALATAPAANAGTSQIAGAAYQDLNRDGVQQAGELPMPDQQLYLFDGAGQ